MVSRSLERGKFQYSRKQVPNCVALCEFPEKTHTEPYRGVTAQSAQDKGNDANEGKRCKQW